MKETTLAQVLPPGEILKRVLASRGWTQADLAEILGRPPRLISEIVGAKRAITPETAHGLGEAFGTGAEFWMNLESLYQLSKLEVPQAISKRARIFGQFPVKEMQKRGWIKHVTQLDAIERELKEFFGVSSIDEVTAIPHVAKKTSYDKVSALQIAWLGRAKSLAQTVAVKKRYVTGNLIELLGKLRECVADPQDSAKVPALLSDAGIRLLLVEPLPGSKIDGACFWLDDEPVVVLTLRFDRHDIFWHALLHELDHIKHEEGKLEPVVDSNLMGQCSHGVHTERRANETAAGTLIPRQRLEEFIARVSPYFSDAQIVGFANQLKVHPGIVVGQLQHKGAVPFALFTRYRAKIREVLTKAAVIDGFDEE